MSVSAPRQPPVGVSTSVGGESTMSAGQFRSILFLQACDSVDSAPEPEFFSDLNLDQILAAVTAGNDQYRLDTLFYTLPQMPETIGYRQEVFRDLENPAILDPIRTFAGQMATMREQFADVAKRYYPRQKQWGILEGIDRYCQAIEQLTEGLASVPLASVGLKSFVAYLTAYRSSGSFQSLVKETHELKEALRHVSYRVGLRDARIEVSHDTQEPDYSELVERTFAKFRQHEEERDYQFEIPDSPDMNHVEAAVLELVVRLHPAVFLSLEKYCDGHRQFIDEVISEFDREVHFYLAYLAHIHRLQAGGLPFCYPQVSSLSKDIECRETFDLALADRSKNLHSIVLNDLVLRDPERVIVVSGANQGGKTTFARLCGQLHYLGRLGCPVPGRSARLWHFDQLFTHFEREEDLRTLRSKLEDDLTRIHEILGKATSRSLLIMNESFSSATLHDALLLSREIMQRIVTEDVICVFVTFLDELASFGPTTVSMTSMVDPQDLVRRTFKIVRRPADGLAYAMALAEKYGLTYESLMQRFFS